MFNYLWYVIRHKWFVFIECCKLGIPWRGLVHDLSKFLPSEFFPYYHHFGKNIKKGRSKTGYYKPTDTGDPAFDYAWFLHQKRNKHHWQYWIFPDDADSDKPHIVFEMPIKYRKEMLADWYGAGRAQKTRGVKFWYEKNGSKLILGPETRKWVEQKLGIK